jgi:hypothetical protein
MRGRSSSSQSIRRISALSPLLSFAVDKQDKAKARQLTRQYVPSYYYYFVYRTIVKSFDTSVYQSSMPHLTLIPPIMSVVDIIRFGPFWIWWILEMVFHEMRVSSVGESGAYGGNKKKKFDMHN